MSEPTVNPSQGVTSRYVHRPVADKLNRAMPHIRSMLTDMRDRAGRAQVPFPRNSFAWASELLYLAIPMRVSPLLAKKRAAAGICDLCREPAPFDTNAGPYLEGHHVQPLADGGPDTIENAVAVCPNCHRKVHILKLAKDLAVLRARIESREFSAVILRPA